MPKKMIEDLERRLEADGLRAMRGELKRRQKLATTGEENDKLLAEFAELDRKLGRLKAPVSQTPPAFVGV